ncbi:MAG: N-6 DNA methylase [Nitrospirae bacterium]|nr:N-6 DNA methylase [Nitrospirota bacterium]
MPKSVLELIDFISSGKPVHGLVNIRSRTIYNLPIDEQAAVRDALTFGHVNFILFRRFSDSRSSQIAAYVIDNTDYHLDEKTLAELHRQVWLYGMAPLLYVAWPSRIDVLSCARGPDFWKAENEECRYVPAKRFEVDTLKTAGAISDELKRFTASRLTAGTFWEDPCNRELANHAKSAHQLLIQAIVEADNELDGKNNQTLRRLLLLMVLIKYLEDRKVFPNEGWFGNYHKGARCFFEVLQGCEPEEVYRLLAALEQKFNGDIFALPQGGRQRLTKKALYHFAELVEAKTFNKQRYLWGQYSFEHLPVEVISHLYQRFVKGGHGAVYTPPFLATLLLDHAMPYNNLTGGERVLDPACGSGIFLTGAFRRLVNVWRSRHNWQRPDVKTLKEILRKSIYGVEFDQDAVHLTAFSLSLAVCDALQPDVIWRELKFDPLHKTNLFEGDFFDVLYDSRQNKGNFLTEGFDIVIGNPPFESMLTDAGKKIDLLAKKEDPKRGALPDKQAAYLFLEQALNLLRSNGRLCLIQPSGLLYNRNAQVFRYVIHRKCKVDSILDFTSIRKLYDEADPKTVAVLVHANKPSVDHWINHLTFRRTVSVHERICFEIDYYDHHRISQAQAETDPYVWRTNLLGGGRLIEISQRLRSLRTLIEYIEQQRGWDYGEGFIVGSGKLPAPFITGKRFLPTAALTTSGIDETKLSVVAEDGFDSPRNKDRFTSPLVLVKELDMLPVAFCDKGFIAYRNQIVGIHAPASQASELCKLYDNFKRNLSVYRFSCAINSTRFLVGKATSILKHDIDTLPYPEDMSDLSFSFWEEALCDDVLQYMTDYARLGQNSALLKNAASLDDLQAYSNMFLRMLGSIYDNLKVADPIFLDGFICQPFYFGKQPNLSWIGKGTVDDLRKLIYNEERHKYLRTIRLLRFYSGNVILIVKPDRLRYWIRSTAIRDADETLIDLYRQGY